MRATGGGPAGFAFSLGHIWAVPLWHEARLGMSQRKVRKDMERTRSYGETRQLTPEKLPLRDPTESQQRETFSRRVNNDVATHQVLPPR